MCAFRSWKRLAGVGPRFRSYGVKIQGERRAQGESARVRARAPRTSARAALRLLVLSHSLLSPPPSSARRCRTRCIHPLLAVFVFLRFPCLVQRTAAVHYCSQVHNTTALPPSLTPSFLVDVGERGWNAYRMKRHSRRVAVVARRAREFVRSRGQRETRCSRTKGY